MAVVQQSENMTRTQKAIAQKLKEIEELRVNGLVQDIIDVLSDKKHTREQIYSVAKAFTADYEKGLRQANIKKARKVRDENKNNTEQSTS